MIEFNILGNSPSTISMVLEILHRTQRDEIRIKIIENTPADYELPFGIEGIETIKVFHKEWDYKSDLDRNVQFLSGVYRPAVKNSVFKFFHTYYGVGIGNYANLIHPTAELAATTRLDKGLHIGPHTVIAPYAVLGGLVTVNRSVSIGHHTMVSDYCTINPGASIAGRCHIGCAVTIGMGSNVLDGLRIGDSSIVGAGALVTKNVPANVVVVGLPANIVKSLS